MVTVQDARDETRRATVTVELHVNGLNVYLPAVQR
jgi:hypothetical protein